AVKRRRRCTRSVIITVIESASKCQALLTMDLEVFPEGGGVGVGLVAPAHPAVVGLVRGVDVHVLLTIAGVGEATIAALDLALERFLACGQEKEI
ncbi:MAG: hypothetical protein ACK56F_29985, partial [bacterium]